MNSFAEIKSFYKGKRVFITGHTGFKGSWLSLMLHMLGAEVYGYALAPGTDPSLYDILVLAGDIHSTIGDIRDLAALEKAYTEANPDVVFHLAAQPIVRDSYKNPRYTYETNVMGTVNILECLRKHPGAVSFLNVTTDKVYENNDMQDHAFTEDEKLDGYDPYSNSKSCSELVTHSYKKSFFSGNESEDMSLEGKMSVDKPSGSNNAFGYDVVKDKASSEYDSAQGENAPVPRSDQRKASPDCEIIIPSVSTARAGNVIGGGDFANDRIIPDCVRATIRTESILVRNPFSTRPYQHVLEPLAAYLMIAMEQALDSKYAGYYNIGPRDGDCINTGDLADCFVKYWGEPANWKNVSEADAPHEAKFLKLDCSKARETFGWEPVWHVDEAIRETVAWYKAWNEGRNMKEFTREQIRRFMD